jgi:hypothetical protein
MPRYKWTAGMLTVSKFCFLLGACTSWWLFFLTHKINLSLLEFAKTLVFSLSLSLSQRCLSLNSHYDTEEWGKYGLLVFRWHWEV